MPPTACNMGTPNDAVGSASAIPRGSSCSQTWGLPSSFEGSIGSSNQPDVQAIPGQQALHMSFSNLKASDSQEATLEAMLDVAVRAGSATNPSDIDAMHAHQPQPCTDAGAVHASASMRRSPPMPRRIRAASSLQLMLGGGKGRGEDGSGSGRKLSSGSSKRWQGALGLGRVRAASALENTASFSGVTPSLTKDVMYGELTTCP